MNINIRPHTAERAKERGASEDEIRDTIENGETTEAKNGLFAKFKIFAFNAWRNGKYYPEKLVKVIYAVMQDTIDTVTVYVFYGKFNQEKEEEKNTLNPE